MVHVQQINESQVESVLKDHIWSYCRWSFKLVSVRDQGLLKLRNTSSSILGQWWYLNTVGHKNRCLLLLSISKTLKNLAWNRAFNLGNKTGPRGYKITNIIWNWMRSTFSLPHRFVWCFNSAIVSKSVY